MNNFKSYWVVIVCMYGAVMISCGKTGGGSTPTPPPTPVATVPVVTTAAITGITQSAATGGGNVTSDGNTTMLGKGICWSSVNQTPTKTDTLTGDGASTGSYTSSLSNLVADRKYYVRAYATNSVGTAYGDVVTFTTAKPVVMPTVATTSATALTDSTATSVINVTSAGNATIFTYGVCYDISPNPTAFNGALVVSQTGTATGSFTLPLKSLWAGTTYYGKAFVTNSAGTAYGSQVTFTTPAAYTIGQSFGGGLITYLDYTGRHGIIVSAVDLNGPNGLSWDLTPVGTNGSFNPPTIGCINTAIGAGKANTEAIVSVFKTGSYAASVCKDYRGGNYTDWFLPSKDELNQIYRFKTTLGIQNNPYYWWSSSEYQFGGGQLAYAQLFSTGVATTDAKFAVRVVRATRYF
jgi:hypothetical protein